MLVSVRVSLSTSVREYKCACERACERVSVRVSVITSVREYKCARERACERVSVRVSVSTSVRVSVRVIVPQNDRTTYGAKAA